MAMIQGSVDSSGAGTGFAKILYDALISGVSFPAETLPDAIAVAKSSIADQANAISGVIGYIQSNAEVTQTISSVDAGLQTYTVAPAGPIPTTPNPLLTPVGIPLANKGIVG